MSRILAIIVLVFNLLSYPQQNDNFYKYWLNAGIGGKHELSSSFAANYNFSISKNFFQVGYHFSGAIITLPDGNLFQPSGGKKFESVNFSYGERLMSEWF